MVDPNALEKALAWAIVRHPMLRAAAEEPSERATDTGPFFHGGKDGRRGLSEAKALRLIGLIMVHINMYEYRLYICSCYILLLVYEVEVDT